MKTYHDCPKKKAARQLTIIDAWRGLSGLPSVPRDRQYWTLSGPLGDGTGVSPGSELGQVVEAGLIHPSQYHGVESDDETYELNRRLLQNSYGGQVRIYHGKIQRVLEDVQCEGRLSPAIVNLDTLCQPELGVKMLGSVIDTLNRADPEGFTMVVLNVILKQAYWGVDYDPNVIWREAEANPFSLSVLEEGGWYRFPKPQAYDGTGSASRTKMCTQIFYRGAR